MIGKNDKDLSDVRKKSETNGRHYKEASERAQKFLGEFKDIKVVEIRRCDVPGSVSRSFIASFTTVGFAEALATIVDVRPDLVLVDGDDIDGNLDDFLETLTVSTVPRVLIMSKDRANIDGVKHLVDHIAFKPVNTQELVKIAYYSKKDKV